MKNTLLFSVVMCGLAGFSSAAIPDAERQALIALYNSTDGANWTVRDNWRNAGDTDFNDPGTECTWYGVTCDPTEDAVREISLPTNNLSGSIPPELGTLSNLETIDFYLNKLTGSIPPELGNLANLYHLLLWVNRLTGSIPPELGNLSDLGALYLSYNQLNGSIPPELGNFSNLFHLYLEVNQLTGSIPPELGNLHHLQALNLGYNQLTGSIPPELGDLSWLFGLYLTSNQLSGNIPAELGNLATLQYLHLDINQLGGSIPPELGTPQNLRLLFLSSNRLSGSIPPELAVLTKLVDSSGLDLRWNALHSSEGALIAFLNSKQDGGDWQSTQTIAPENLGISSTADHTVWLDWDGVTYVQSGGYELYFKETTSSQWLLGSATSSKSTTSFPVAGLDPATQFDFAVKTYTKPHASNQNRVLSDFSSPVTATTANTGSYAPVIRKSGSSPWTLYTTEIFDSYLWSTGESTRIISVDPADTTWYWVTTTAAGSSDESATLVVDPNLPAEVFADGFEGGTTAAWSKSIS